MMPILSFSSNSCGFPWAYEEIYINIDKMQKEVFAGKDFLVFFFYYKPTDPLMRDNYSEFHFQNLLNLAEKKWGKTENLDIDNYIDKEGRTIPFVLVELGGTVSKKGYHNMPGLTKISTCYDRQKYDSDNLMYFESGEYGTVIEDIENYFLPMLAMQDKKERSQ